MSEEPGVADDMRHILQCFDSLKEAMKQEGYEFSSPYQGLSRVNLASTHLELALTEYEEGNDDR